jgi:2-polyprenyl-3-methyl-5-hydroxy-6-metoxy-1,4-benzoquinol methylase
MSGKIKLQAVCPICEREVEAILIEECEWGYKMLRCPFCSLEFASPFKGLGKGGYEELFEKGRAETKDCALEAKRYMERVLRYKRQRLGVHHLAAIKYLKRCKFHSKRLLDVGCAEGTFIKRMEELGFEVYGCDIAEKPIRFAREVYGLENVIASQVEELPEAWKDFDVITAFEVLEHTENPLGFLKCLYNLLKTGGYLLLSVPHFESLHQILDIRIGDNPPLHLTRWHPKALKLALEKVGFQKEEIVFFDIAASLYSHCGYFLHTILPRKVIMWYSGPIQRGAMVKVEGGKQNKVRFEKESIFKSFLKRTLKWAGRFVLSPFFILLYPLLKRRFHQSRLVIAKKSFRNITHIDG